MLAPALILVLYVIIEAGRFIWTQNSLQLAADEGSRYAAAHPDATVAEIKSAAEARLIGISTGDVTWTITPETGIVADFVTVKADHTFTLVAPLLTEVDAALLKLSATSRTPVPP